MRRFVDRSFTPGSLESDAADLLRSASAPEEAAEARQRVRERVMAARPPGLRGMTPVRRLVFLSAMGVGVAVFAAVAGATWGTGWWRSARRVPATASAVRSLAAAPEIREAELQAAPESKADDGLRIAPSPVADIPGSVRSPRAKHARSADEVTEAGLLFEAARVLRRDQDPVRAGMMLEEYFRRFPRGALGEEALALAVEAATARGDARRIELARRYLARYPRGQFRATAERALSRDAP